MEAAQKIRQAVADVSLLRKSCSADAALHDGVKAVKRTQGSRFAGTYRDLLAGGPFAAPTRFFLEELYGDADYTERDAQFARIAGAMEKFFPADVTDTAVALARLHALTEDLDFRMGQAWVGADFAAMPPAQRYVAAWRRVGRRADREAQLQVVLGIGNEMARLTRLPGLRLMLKMMRGPAAAAGMGSLQRFLETGFDTFSSMAQRPGGAETFLSIVRERETKLIAMLFDADLVACEAELALALGQAP
ncbi:MAG TPA: hypothetical protein VHA82_09830 [Ramlibacter sp.]|uniref:FFLEELY motif protein n=1 Tax=Ramlibacter sp. TaxID=1917967 RepID=UPI002B538E15|nr:hypothetical protein [Ramlibacter sp.]HVZ44100.1 hypothetical protein [Ramlibacter sp.]